MRHRLAAIVLVIPMLIPACSGPKGGAATRPPPLTDLQVAETWLECLDCRGSFLRRLDSIPPGTRDTVVQFLAAALISGPDSARTARVERDLRRVWYADSAYAVRRGDSLRTTRADYLARYRLGFHAMWRSRAATALGVLRTQRALEALGRAAKVTSHTAPAADSAIKRAIARARADSTRSILDSSP